MAEFCKVCGAEIPEDSAVCPVCGNDSAPEVTEMESVPMTEPVEVTEAAQETEAVVHQEPETVTDMEAAPETEVSQEYPAVPVEGEKKAVKWWMIAVPVAAVVFAAVLAVALMGDAIYIRIAPHAVLSEAIANTASDLSSRGEGTLWESVENAVGEEGKYTSQMDIALVYDTYMSGNLSIAGKNDLFNYQSQVDINGNLDVMGYVNYELGLDLYMDGDCLALNWAQATGGDYYGIVYDSFGEDIRSNELLSSGIDEESLTMFEEYIDMYREQLDLNTSVMDGMEFSKEYGSVVIEFLKEHKALIGSETMTSEDGLALECSTITYTVTDAEMNALAKDLLAVLENDEAVKMLYESTMAMQQYADPEEDVSWETYIADCYAALEEDAESDGVSTYCFYLYNERLVYADYSCKESEEEVTLSVGFGENAGEDDITILFTILTEDTDGEMEIILSREIEENTVSEKLNLCVSDYDINVDWDISYAWDKDSGDFTVDFSGIMDGETAEFTLDMKLYEKEEGIFLEFPELFGLMASMYPEDASSFEGLSCNISYSILRGAEIAKPEFINIREITEEDVAGMSDNISNYYG